MHRGEMVVSSQGLDDRVLVAVFMLKGLRELPEGVCAFVASIHTAVSRCSEVHILIAPANLAGFAVVVIGPRYDSPVNVTDEFGADREIIW